jgi:hypothetical protein
MRWNMISYMQYFGGFPENQGTSFNPKNHSADRHPDSFVSKSGLPKGPNKVIIAPKSLLVFPKLLDRCFEKIGSPVFSLMTRFTN